MSMQECEHAVFIFSIRESGVDHIPFTASRLTDAAGYHNENAIYRKIYALSVKSDEHEITADLYDMTKDLPHAAWKREKESRNR